MPQATKHAHADWLSTSVHRTWSVRSDKPPPGNHLQHKYRIITGISHWFTQKSKCPAELYLFRKKGKAQMNIEVFKYQCHRNNISSSKIAGIQFFWIAATCILQYSPARFPDNDKLTWAHFGNLVDAHHLLMNVHQLEAIWKRCTIVLVIKIFTI